MRLWRNLFWTFFICTLALTLSACASEAAQPNSAPAAPRLALESCSVSTPGLNQHLNARCGKLNVPEDPAQPQGRQITLNIAVVPAVSRSPLPDPIFFLAGGPGESATQSYLIIASAFMRLNQKRDVVLVDQRGTGGSNPLSCPPPLADETDQAAYLQRCLAELEADPALYTTSIAMHDLEQARLALGYGPINIYAASYGTRAALVYARLYPQSVRTLTLDGLAPLDWQLGPNAGADAQRALELILARCAAEVGCNRAFPDLPQKFNDLLARLQAGPVEVALTHPTNGEPVTFTLDADSLAHTVHQMTYLPETAALLPLMIESAHSRQDYTSFAAQALTSQEALAQAINEGLYLSVLCAEDVPFYPDPLPASGYLGSGSFAPLKDACQVWPRRALPPGFHDPLTSDIPTLLLSGEADPVTPPANAERAAQTLSNSRTLVAPGQGHIIIYRGCVPDIVEDFIESASVAGLDTTCIENYQPLPFFVNFNGPQP